jgi:non-specific serine/threonine protein kinase
MLVVLDNCEHLVESCAKLAEHVLRACPRVTILATSREALGIASETAWLVPPLLSEEAVQLFVDRARAALPTFAPANDAAVRDICRRLDGIPLAIELAAARVNVLSVEQIAERLADAVRLLVGGSRTSPARHQTLQATFEWSHDLLSEPERLLLARVSVFAGGWTLEAAEAVCGSVPLEREHILDLLGQLVDKSLILVEPGDGGVPRYRLLEPLRQFAAERLAERGATADLRQRHAAWVSALVDGAASSYHGPNEPIALDRLAREHANIQAGFDWLLDGQGQVDDAARLAGGLWWFWTLRDNWLEARSRLKRLLDASPRPGTTSQPTVLWIAGSMAWHQGDLAAAREWIDACLVTTREQAQPGLLARAVAVSGHLAAARGEYATARRAFEEGLESSRLAGDRWAEARNLDGLATLALEEGDFGTAEDLLGRSLALARAMGDTWSLAAVLNTLGDVARTQADYARARRLYEESLARFGHLGTALGASVLHNLGYVAIQEHEHERSAELFGESLRMYQAFGEQRGMAECLVGLACLAAAGGQSNQAARLFAAAEAAFRAIGAELSPSNRADRAHWVAAARAGLSEAAFAAASAAGSALSLDEAIREAVGAAPAGRFSSRERCLAEPEDG